MFAVPITGWIMVSASPLNVQTLLFDVIPWPHLPPFSSLENKRAIAEAFHEYHELAGHLLIALLLLHIGAVVKHRLIDHDDVLARMTPPWRSTSFRRLSAGTAAAILIAAGSLWVYASQTDNGGASLTAGASNVSFVAMVSGDEVPGNFDDSSVTFTLDEADPSASTLEAEVQTASYSTDNPQVRGSIGGPDWFHVQQFPRATFASTSISADGERQYVVDGDMTIKGKTEAVSFTMTLEDVDGKQRATGEFPVKRLDFGIGAESQPDDSNVALEVIIRFDFELGSDTAGQS